ncbi:endonuclease/exonuclease/phosphatase family protein [Corallococcus llansteffanensis]|uniref:Endonuclease/exonuclease/phosphatase family protein n=1 Tax=Corallococcus llansteffanensis TaxID=2316731 RepID=A0A3A8PLY8_9BACT|nr:endonuclease/exonuclease/phosphatase family protein [Corallococcus llansteffanensis]RKH57119.1 endonuclease/exonuclease/phosphatase family protein [Corallococcus llansteffanensis]
MPLKVMTLNILMGGEERMPQLLALIARENPDVLALQECLGWEDGERLGQVAAALNLPATEAHVRLGTARPRSSGRRYHVAVVSRLPLRSSRDHANPHFIGHCLLECELETGAEPLTVFVAHFDSHHETLRFVEARYLRSLLEPKVFGERAFLLAGDLNSLSRADPYPVDFADRVRRGRVDKYGHPPRFDVIDDLEGFGWRDTLRLKPTSPRWVTAHRQRDGGEAVDFRTDYLFASPALARRLLGAEVVEVGTASDHHALTATFTGV